MGNTMETTTSRLPPACTHNSAGLPIKKQEVIKIESDDDIPNKRLDDGSANKVPEEVAMESREASPTHFQLKIESFSLHFRNGIDKYETGEFAAEGYKWRLIICPNGDKTGQNGGYISVYLAISDTSSLPTNWDVTATFSIFLFNHISCNYLYSLGTTRRFLPIKSEWGFSKFISKDVLTDPSNGYLMDDNCVFGAEILVVKKSAAFECLSLKNVTVPYKRDWKISNFSNLGDRWTSEEFSAGGHKWSVVLYPKGWGDGKGSDLSIYLNLLDSKRVKAAYTICMKNQLTGKHQEGTDCRWFSASDKILGWSSFIHSLDWVHYPDKGFVVDDCCLLEIEISVQATAQ